MDRTPPQSKDLIEIVRSKTICAVTIQTPLKWQRKGKKGGAAGSQTQVHFIITKSRVIKGEEGRVVVGGCCGFLQWQSADGLRQRAWV